MSASAETPFARVVNLALEYRTQTGPVRALDGASLDIATSSTLGVVGESGSGKTTLGMAIGRLLPASAVRLSGELVVDGKPVFDLPKEELRMLRRTRLGFVFQNPMTALDPTMRIRRQLERAAGGRLTDGPALDMLRRVGLPDPDRVARSYPHELSGGMAQRVVVAMAVARNPMLLIADEPTSALDATVRIEILSMLIGLKDRLGTGLLVLSHELHIVATFCTEVAVMYGGRVVEHGPSALLFARPRHPYTRALIRAAPGSERQGERLDPIPGTPPLLREAAAGCAFAPRCIFAVPRCHLERPEPRFHDGRTVLCHRVEELSLAAGDQAA